MNDTNLKDTILEELDKLYYIVDDEDIPHPTVPEYIEHHQSIIKIKEAINLISKNIKEDF